MVNQLEDELEMWKDADGDYDAIITILEQQIGGLETQIADLEEEKELIKDDRDTFYNNWQNALAEIGGLELQVGELQTEINVLSNQNETDVAELQNTITELRDELTLLSEIKDSNAENANKNDLTPLLIGVGIGAGIMLLGCLSIFMLLPRKGKKQKTVMQKAL